MFDLAVTITGGERISSILNQLALDATRQRQLLSILGDVVITQTQLRFRDQTDPDGVPWKPSIRALEQGGQTLVDTGALRSSITKLVTDGQVEVGTNLPYANAMQYGLNLVSKGKPFVFKVVGRWVTLKQISYPGRPFLGINDADNQELNDTVVDFLEAFVAEVSS